MWPFKKKQARQPAEMKMLVFAGRAWYGVGDAGLAAGNMVSKCPLGYDRRYADSWGSGVKVGGESPIVRLDPSQEPPLVVTENGLIWQYDAATKQFTLDGFHI